MMIDFFNNLERNFQVDKLNFEYLSSDPVQHVIIDNFLPTEVFNQLCIEIKTFPQDKWLVKNLPNSGVRKESRDFTNSPVMQEMMIHLTSQMFVKWMSKITKCENIIPDIHHLGGGLSSAPSGSSLGLHVDFNWNDTLKLNRKFNLILYANETWDSTWNGNLEFWNKQRTECLYTVEPKPNRLVFWEYEQEFVHGFSKPLCCPIGIERQNLMTIYYTSNATPESIPHKSDFY